ncbi:phosphoesterase, MJ0936 family [Vreelandella subterranea]|uniref:Phosphoesterase n=1 Tax=Vreelandella subterranea TaxID=416874 RepID=A0A1H9WLD9_9GAMM|nr:metallophosphoesterase family protein [Halomonas subterranea]SES34685.1 phosphoesterase, MJ0936 family [Halomonas subterranea]
MKIAVLSDLHSNIYAFKNVLNDLDNENVSKILIAGDLIGYYYWPHEIIKRIRFDNRFICIRGNHEHILQEVLTNRGAAQRHRVKYGSGYKVCQQLLSESDLEWLLSLPDEIDLSIDGVTFHIEHGTLGTSDKYLYPDAPLAKLLKNYSDAKYTIFGHTHYPFLHEHQGRYLLNPGSVGQPRDTGGLASYIIINTDNDVIRFKRTSFDKLAIINASREHDPNLGYLADIMNR